ncbi:peptidoglycan DD-metalloendopeptidase family protein [Streptomyces sp. LP11]|uniref:Peptidoglycan DD-metalloendopeptidase family protein n=1 Tax=Streptomyces pyxinicus TaxID=2970331 RepID=A0ABT2AW67_9ACTN|nr:peptidoglycan DD-metalloendopeptidase family protein [Streptomyces sp. LP11]MCS0600135.1 peptidoglycan DD-metalloendopeptidase family protein [Streptomyces sp. LP11]
MNDRHPSGTLTTPAPASDASAPYAQYGVAPEVSYDDLTTQGGHDATGFPGGAADATAFHADPLFGSLPDNGPATGTYETTQWQTGTGQFPPHDPYAAQHQAAYGTGAYDTGAWTVPAQATANDTSGQWDTGTWSQAGQAAAPDATQQWEWGTQAFDTGAYDATQWNSAGHPVTAETEAVPFDQQATATFEQVSYEEAGFGQAPYEETGFAGTGLEETGFEGFDFEAGQGDIEGGPGDTGELPVVTELLDGQEEVVPAPVPRAGARGGARSRRRTPAKRSALLTVAVPSVCVMGVAGIAAASVSALTNDSPETTASASEAHAVQPSAANSRLDSQLKTLSAGADDFADRASRTQERIDLKTQKAQEAKKAAAEAARKERLRPKFALPVTQRGLSAYFGQAGVNWMSVHTGIDFPVSYGTTVMAATDGTVTTKWNSAYGNMLIVTAKDGTETWYCHLSSYRVASGTTVKAGQPVAYSGNSGNSTGPHLHFEVRPAGGAAIDPLPWLRSHGLDPT